MSFVRALAPSRGIYLQRADGSAPAESVYAHPKTVDEITWTPDGRTAVVRHGSGGTRTRDIFALRPGIDTMARPLVAGVFDEFGAAVSPDGRWIAYASLESGRSEVFVRRFDDPGAGRSQVSVDGGDEPLWAHNGRELFYRSSRGDFLVADVGLQPTFAVRGQRTLFNRANLATDPFHRSYDVAPGDQRFVMVNRAASSMAELILVVNWPAGLAR